jgi:glycerophosphoryl diester phosphodiesterase
MIVIAHRGASAELPENTLPAFERAIEHGAPYVEFDVHRDREGALVVTHDPPVAGAAYPRLEEVLDLCRGRIGVMVELKRPRRYPGMVARALELVDDDAIILSFERAALVEVRARRPALLTMQHVGLGCSIRGAAGAWAVGFRDDRVTTRGLAAARRLGLATAVYTVNDVRRMIELDRLGVMGVFTDLPARALTALRRPPAG